MVKWNILFYIFSITSVVDNELRDNKILIVNLLPTLSLTSAIVNGDKMRGLKFGFLWISIEIIAFPKLWKRWESLFPDLSISTLL